MRANIDLMLRALASVQGHVKAHPDKTNFLISLGDLRASNPDFIGKVLDLDIKEV